MERSNLNHRDNSDVLVDRSCSPQRAHSLAITSQTQRYSNSDIDFNDVFGGPPRRSSIQEMRYSLNESPPDRCRSGFDMPAHRNPWTGLREKPVFGEENTARRRYVSEDFYDDIYKGNESACSSPRKNERDPFSSAPGSRVLSPARPLPPRASPLGSPSIQFSLPAKLNQPMDLPAFGWGTHDSYKHKDGVNGATGLHTPKVSISGFSSPKTQVQEDYVKLPRSSYRPSPLSLESSLGSESPDLVKPKKLDNQKKDSVDSPDLTSKAQFHFSIYKWASKGIPLTMPLRRASSFKGRDKVRTERLSSKEKIEHQSRFQELTTSAARDDNGFPSFHTKEINDAVCETDNHNPESDLIDDSLQVEGRDSQAVEEELILKDKTDVPECKESCSLSDETKPQAPLKTILQRSMEKEIDNKIEQNEKKELKTLQSFLSNKEDGKGNDEHGITKKTGGRNRKQKSTKNSSVHAVAAKDEKKHDGESHNSIEKTETKASPRGSPVSLQDDMERNRGKGKVKDFIKIFNQQSPSKPESKIHPRSQSSRKSDPGISKTDDEAINMASGIYANGNMFPGEQLKATQATSGLNLNLDELHKQPDKTSSSTNACSLFSDSSSGQKISSGPSMESPPEIAKVKAEAAVESFHKNFMIKELSEDENKQREDQEKIRAIDAKIRKWSNGKEGNIRSLLSTLQYVLWPGSGWKPIPLVDIIEGPAVKKAYQRALLCVHPDKLQQKGAASHQKYTAQQVFDILQDAWDHFNSLGSL